MPHIDVTGEPYPEPANAKQLYRDHRCSNDCLCFAVDCPCDYCRPITAAVDKLIKDKRR